MWVDFICSLLYVHDLYLWLALKFLWFKILMACLDSACWARRIFYHLKWRILFLGIGRNLDGTIFE